MYEITFKTTKRSRQTFTWQRFGSSIEDATATAKTALLREYYGSAVLVGVREMSAAEVAAVRA